MIDATYIAHSGNDLLVVDAARVSFAKASRYDADGVMLDSDVKLINYLVEHGHWSPFSHPQITMRVKAPVFVRTQCFKHKVGFAENEVSRRYVDDEPEFFMPDVWRGRPTNAKQGSDGVVDVIDRVDIIDEDSWTAPVNEEVGRFYDEALGLYRDMISSGVAPEQARVVLPQAMLTEWVWTGSLAAWARFYRQRTDLHAQQETRDLAERCALVVAPLFPRAWTALTR